MPPKSNSDEEPLLRGRALARGALPLTVCLFWVPLYVALSVTWISGFYYEHGWLVGPAALFFLWARLRDSPGRISRRTFKPPPSLLAFTVALIFTLLLATIRVVEQVDVTWRMILLIHGAFLAASTFFFVWFVYGRMVAMHFLPVILFTLLALPLPTPVERPLIQQMTEWVIGFTAQALVWIGNPIQIQGNTLLSIGGQVDVTEGCSGIRSFQSLVVASLFFGELFRLAIAPRLALVAFGVIAGFFTNTGRAFTLSLISIRDGHDAFDEAHDPVGFVAFLAALISLFLLARWMDNRNTARPLPSATRPTSGKPAQVLSSKALYLLPLASALSLVAVELAVFAWYSESRQPELTPAPRLNLLHPKTEDNLIVEELDFTKNRAADVIGSSDVEWIRASAKDLTAEAEIYLFHYEPRNPFFFVDAFDHGPELCMGSSGYEVSILPERVLDLPAGELRFHAVAFRDPLTDRALHVFKTRSIDGIGSIARSYDRNDMIQLRLEMARAGRRSPRASVMEAGIQGLDSVEESWNFFTESFLGMNTELEKKSEQP
ncbi:MAG: exosortase/archaeosortase family protein [Verrucomicrobiota bacterium]